MAGDNDGFMNNEKLYNLIEKMSDKLNEVYIELKQTQSKMRKYNGIREDVSENKKNISTLTSNMNKISNRIESVEGEEKGEKNQREKIAWLIALIMTIINLLSILGVV